MPNSWVILLDHWHSHALTTIAVFQPDVYLQQIWRTVSKVLDTEDTIKFMLDTQQFIYTMDMFRDTLHLPVETPENPFVAPANIHTIEAFINRVGYQGVVDKKKEAIQYPRFIKLIVADLMKKFPDIPKRLEEDYHSIKDDVPLVSVYTTGNVLVRGMLIPDAFLTAEIRETNDFKEYETVFMKVDVPMNQPQPVVSTQGMHRITPSAHSKQVEKDDDDSEDRIEPESHKDNPEVVVDDDDDDNEREKKDDEMGRIDGLLFPNSTISTSKQPQVKKQISSKYSHLPGALRKMCRRQDDDDPPEGEKRVKSSKNQKVQEVALGGLRKAFKGIENLQPYSLRMLTPKTVFQLSVIMQEMEATL
ncbi:hypothetical protein Tco_1090376 [Tanacetum coccineum]|uniref:Uncharacterized protein n=1 Tax=Tanacetum coccineum TaxID=301880 RepID=A0ABQ5I463_9ASTR